VLSPGVMNCAGNFAGIFGPMTAGFIISGTGNWAFPFLVAAGFAFVSFLVLYFLVVPKPIEVTAPLPQTVAQEARV
jgi:MFS family permease